MSLVNQVNKTNTFKYSTFTVDELEKSFKGLFSSQLNKDSMIVYTGTTGMNMINLEMKRQFILSLLKQAYKLCTKNELKTLRSMIHSSDEENMVVAECILVEKLKEL